MVRLMQLSSPWTELEELALKELWESLGDGDTMDKVGMLP
jgi:hypothetical protein